MRRIALLMDGGYVIKRLQGDQGRIPSASDIRALARRLASRGGPRDLYRVFFYHADPYRGSHRRPLTGEQIAFGGTDVARNHDRLLKDLDVAEDFAVRRGVMAFFGWRVSGRVQDLLQENPGHRISGKDFVPDLVQKGVDMRIGLDMAALALKRLVDTVVLVTDDADMIPAMRFARREGLRVGLCSLGSGAIRRALREHADFVLDGTPDSRRGVTGGGVLPASGR